MKKNIIYLLALCLNIFPFFTVSASQDNEFFYGKTEYTFPKDPIDVIIPCTKKDVATLELCIESIKKNVKDLRRIIIISPEHYTDSAEWFDEKLYPFSFFDVGYHIYGKNSEKAQWFSSYCQRRGWIYQQLLKIYAPFVIPGISSNVLIVDSDVIFYKPVEFVDESGAGLYNPGSENHWVYFAHMDRLLPGLKRVYPHYSGISHHMLFQRSVLEDLFDHVETYHDMPFWQAVCSCIDPNEIERSCLSEYEIYFNFAFSRSDQVKIRHLHWMNAGDISQGTREHHSRCNLDYVAYHAYNR